MVRLTFVAPTVLFALQALADPEPADDSLASALIRRQFSGGAPAVSGSDSSDCQGPCNGYLNSVTACQNSTTLSCYCTQSVFNNMASCIDCALAVDSSLSQQDEQSSVNDAASACQQEGFSVSTPTLKATKNAASMVKVCGFGLFAAIAASVMLA